MEFVTEHILRAIKTSCKLRQVCFLYIVFSFNFSIGSSTLGDNKNISSGILVNSFIALIIKELAGLNISVFLPVIIFPFGNFKEIRSLSSSSAFCKAGATTSLSSIERFTSGGTETMQHALKPKRFYSYTYTIVKNVDGSYSMVDGLSTSNNAVSYHEVDFTMDDYITHRVSNKGLGYNSFDEATTKSFYLSDTNNNSELIGSDITDPLLLDEVVNKLSSIRRDIIVDTVVKELSYATNNNNAYARSAGITYSFSFPTTSQEDMYASIENVGLVAFVQGISVGNKYLNTKAFGITRLTLATRYYFTVPSADSKFNINLYHKDKNCPEYQLANKEKMTPEYTLTKQQAASMTIKCQVEENGSLLMKEFRGFYPCKVCNP